MRQTLPPEPRQFHALNRRAERPHVRQSVDDGDVHEFSLTTNAFFIGHIRKTMMLLPSNGVYPWARSREKRGRPPSVRNASGTGRHFDAETPGR